MQVKIEPDLEGLLPWDLTLEVAGVGYPTKRPRLGLMLRIQRLESLTLDEAHKIVPELFDGPSPDVSQLYNEELAQILSRFTLYYAEQSRKNSETVARMMMAQATAKTSPGKTSPNPQGSKSQT